MSELEDKGCLFVVLLGVFALAILITSMAGYRHSLRALRAQAIQHGYAEYQVDEHGNTAWRWIEPRSEEVVDE